MPKLLLGILSLSFSVVAFAASVPLPWPGENPPGYSGPPQAAPAGPIQGLIVQPQAFPPPQQYNTQDMQQQQMLQQLLQQLGGGGKNSRNRYPFLDDDGGADLLDGMSSSYGYKSQSHSDGRMEDCKPMPQRVQAAFKEAIDFRGTCEPAQRGDGQRVVINDFSTTSRGDEMPYMYIFGLNGECLGKTAVTYGNGLGPVVPEPCSDNGHHLTPPGFHLTGYHSSDSFPEGTSLGLIALEGQETNARGVLIHGAARPGTASSFGCAGVGCFDTVKETLGEGALVYNYFGDKGKAKGCNSEKGLDHSQPCHLESPQRAIPQTATGVGTPAMK